MLGVTTLPRTSVRLLALSIYSGFLCVSAREPSCAGHPVDMFLAFKRAAALPCSDKFFYLPRRLAASLLRGMPGGIGFADSFSSFATRDGPPYATTSGCRSTAFLWYCFPEGRRVRHASVSLRGSVSLFPSGVRSPFHSRSLFSWAPCNQAAAGRAAAARLPALSVRG